MNETKILKTSSDLNDLVKVFVDAISGNIPSTKEMKEALRESINELCGTISKMAFELCPYE